MCTFYFDIDIYIDIPLCTFSVSSDMDHQVKSLLRSVKFLCRLFKQTTVIPPPGFDGYTNSDAFKALTKANAVFKVKLLLALVLI